MSHTTKHPLQDTIDRVTLERVIVDQFRQRSIHLDLYSLTLSFEGVSEQYLSKEQAIIQAFTLLDGNHETDN